MGEGELFRRAIVLFLDRRLLPAKLVVVVGLGLGKTWGSLLSDPMANRSQVDLRP